MYEKPCNICAKNIFSTLTKSSFFYELKRSELFLVSVGGNKCACENCEHEEEIESAFLRSVKEQKLLFPDRKITTNEVHEWCV
jgi:hypothetical protein